MNQLDGPPRHHPGERALLLFGAGRLGPAFRAAIAVHAADCPRCGALLRAGMEVGGALLEDEPETPLAPGALERTLAGLDERPPPVPALSALLSRQPRPVAPGVRHRRLLAAEGESLHLFRVRSGASLPLHDHGGEELTCVLEGAFEDDTGAYAAGDAVALRTGTAHAPVAVGGSDCTCLVAISGRLRFTMSLPRIVRRLLGF